MLEPYNGSVFDPCCGSGGMFVQSEEFVTEHQGRVNDMLDQTSIADLLLLESTVDQKLTQRWSGADGGQDLTSAPRAMTEGA